MGSVDYLKIFEELNGIYKDMYKPRVLTLPEGAGKADKDKNLYNIDFSEFDAWSPWRTYHGCDHKWVEYTGLNEKFEYCSKCDKKRDNNEEK